MTRSINLVLTMLRTNRKARRALVAAILSLSAAVGLARLDPEMTDTAVELVLAIAGALTDA